MAITPSQNPEAVLESAPVNDGLKTGVFAG